MSLLKPKNVKLFKALKRIKWIWPCLAIVTFLFISRSTEAAFVPHHTPEMQAIRARVLAEKAPLHFAFIREFNPYFGNAYCTFFHGEVHRILQEYSPPKGSLEYNMLEHLNDPNNPKMVYLRKYMTYMRRILLSEKPESDPYKQFLKPDGTVYILISKVNGDNGPMTQINVANLILSEAWTGKNFLKAKPSDGKIVYAYFLMANGSQRKVADLFGNRELFESFIVHLGLRLIEGEGRGQARGLDAHLDAHTGPWINLGYGTTWCQNRAFYESWALAHGKLLTEIFPETFKPAVLSHLPLMDRFFYFSNDPWTENFEPLNPERLAWNTPQAILRSNYINALFQVEMWNDPTLQRPIEKSVRILGKKGSTNLHEFFHDWWDMYPEDRPKLGKTLLELTHDTTVKPLGQPGDPVMAPGSTANDYLKCLGPDLWISYFPKFNRFDQLNFNASSIVEMQDMFERMFPSKTAKDVWRHATDANGNDLNLIGELAKAIFQARGERCGQFKDMKEIYTFVKDFGREKGISYGSIIPVIWKIYKAREMNIEVYQNEKKTLVRVGAYQKHVAKK